MIRKVGLVVLLFSLKAQALVPVEGILMGEAVPELQTDPLSFIFRDIYDKSRPLENAKIQHYQNFYRHGRDLTESCSKLKEPTYPEPFQTTQARRSVAATLQLIGLDSSIKAIGAYSRVMELSEEEYNQLTSNLVSNYCSKNITVMSLRNISQSLQHYYKNPQEEIIPTVESSPFAPEVFKQASEGRAARSRELDFAVRNFRTFCSWGGETEDYRIMAPHLSNPFIQGMLIERITLAAPVGGKLPPSKVVCRDLICRQVDHEEFTKRFPLTIGSTGLKTDLQKLYCHHFRFQDYEPRKTLPRISEWIKKTELEDPILETNFLISLMTGVPDVLFGASKYNEVPAIVKSSIDERWNKWAQTALDAFSKDLLYEESLKVRAEAIRNPAALRSQGFRVDFNVTVGEIDRLLNDVDKLDTQFELTLSKNFLRSLRIRWNEMAKRVAPEERKFLIKDTAKYIQHQLDKKEKLFQQKMWNEEFAGLIASEILSQVLVYEGPLFDNYKDEMLKVPVSFSYGLFALNYLRYRADVNAGRLKLNL